MNQKKLKVKGILFDLDGTIVDSKQAYVEAARAAFESAGQKPPETRDSLEIPRRLEQSLPINDIVRFDVQRFLDVYLKTYYNVTRTMTRLVPNAEASLQVLSGKAKLALITMRFVPKTAVIEELERFGLAEYFTYVVTALDTHKPKPSPEALIKAVKALDVNMCDCVIVGDSVIDMRAGKAAGAMTVAVLSGLFSREELSRETPDLILKDVTELPLFLDYFN
ncbi:MAG TPA: HAD family hydrolase [Candidatus Bathyarchaeia archaeon]|nr:HAD family hydrolase [Candidatus Bathyarchaeia archaeon]